MYSPRPDCSSELSIGLLGRSGYSDYVLSQSVDPNETTTGTGTPETTVCAAVTVSKRLLHSNSKLIFYTYFSAQHSTGLT